MWRFFLDTALFSCGSSFSPECCLRVSEANLKSALMEVLALAAKRRRSSVELLGLEEEEAGAAPAQEAGALVSSDL